MRFDHARGDARHPLETKLKPDHKYKWCACGKTEEVPWCDGTCEDGKPVKFYVDRKDVYRICNCGMTSTPPHCDGSHGNYQD